MCENMRTVDRWEVTHGSHRYNINIAAIVMRGWLLKSRLVYSTRQSLLIDMVVACAHRR
jgi:hypothetical protein